MKIKTYILPATLLVIAIASLYWSRHAALPIVKSSSNPLAENSQYNTYYFNKLKRKKQGHVKSTAPEEISKINRALRTPLDLDAPSYAPDYYLKALQRARKKSTLKKSEHDFISRGPGNVGGRTRGLLVYPHDETQQTWLAGSATGGIWKTTDGGTTWRHTTSDLPNLGTNTLAYSESNPDIVYAGTGEFFTNDIDGMGLFKSEDFGDTWELVSAATDYPDMRNISRIIVDPNDPNTVLLTAQNSRWADNFQSTVFKTTDGGQSWRRVFTSTTFGGGRFDDIDFNPQNFNTMYLCSNARGIYKSTDAGETWRFISSAKQAVSGRLELAISPLDTNLIWVSAEGFASGVGSDLYRSADGGQHWELVTHAAQDRPFDFLGGQGWYDNTILAHPFDPNSVYVGGVSLYHFSVDPNSPTRLQQSMAVNKEEAPFLDFINFGGALGSGGIDFGSAYNIDNAPQIELRFGEGPQKAHRFTVEGRGPGVPPQDYIYQDYVDVPFQAWDVDRNQQLMISFRDQQEDGEWSLTTTRLDGETTNHSREYIFIHNIDYQESPDSTITQIGGTETDQIYFMWPVLTEEGEFFLTEDGSFPQARLSINRVQTTTREFDYLAIGDVYRQHEGLNSFIVNNDIEPAGVHPDQHNLQAIITDSANQEFRLLIANDGGLAISKASTQPGRQDDDFEFVSYGYITSQFYGADKAPNENRYIGGTQDNGTWMASAPLLDSSHHPLYTFELGGDGFECIWNNRDPKLLLGSSQFNNFSRSDDGGASWAPAGTGDNGPFISRLANSKSLPDRVFTVGVSGVWISDDFGLQWRLTPISESDLKFSNSIDIEVSRSNPDIVGVASSMSNNHGMLISTNGGDNFTVTNGYQYEDRLQGPTSGFGFHPRKDSTVYALFSFQGRAKVIKSNDLGAHWEDISGYDNREGVSANGFPDVATNCIHVFRGDTSRIWVGTEIGIVESTDGGQSWSLLPGALQGVNVYDFNTQDDQLIIATYGSGIWTATGPGIEFYDNIVFTPVISAGYLTPENELIVEINFSNVFDSSTLYYEGQPLSTIQHNEIGDVNVRIPNTLNSENPNITLTLISYLDGQGYETDYTMPHFTVSQPITRYNNNFEEIEKLNDFSGDEFRIYQDAGFTSNAIHSPHPYATRQEYTYQLTKPIRIEGRQTLRYSDIAIIEPGLEGSIFSGPGFYDYVAVEYSTDGNTWTTLAEGYDSRLDSLWLETYFTAELLPDENYYRTQEIPLWEYIDEGEIVFIRFTLFSDPGAVGWGWAIDNIVIDEALTTSIETQNEDNVQVFPNPFSDYINIDLDPSSHKAIIRIYNYEGQLVIEKNLSGRQKAIINTPALESGQYILSINHDDNIYTQKILKIN